MQTGPITEIFESELDAQLAADAHGSLRRQLLQDLQQTEARLRGQLARPLPRDEFNATLAGLKAVCAAQAVLHLRAPTAASLPAAGGGVAHRQQLF